MNLPLLTCMGGTLVLPDRNLVLVDRQTGGNLVVNPPRVVWERSELTATELTHWSFLVAAAGRAMLDVLPQLTDGCINYWEAGNWALHDAAEPKGPKNAQHFRQVHLHLLGRSRMTTNPDWRWGEAPRFPAFAARHTWAADNERLTATECQQIVTRAILLLQTQYSMPSQQSVTCAGCGYPTPPVSAVPPVCAECSATESYQ